MNKKHKMVLEKIFKKPISSDLKWNDVEALFKHLDAEITGGSGSRVRIALNSIKAVFHRPHPRRVCDKGAVVSIRKFLENAGVKYEV